MTLLIPPVADAHSLISKSESFVSTFPVAITSSLVDWESFTPVGFRFTLLTNISMVEVAVLVPSEMV